jgi:hypothetical protein
VAPLAVKSSCYLALLLTLRDHQSQPLMRDAEVFEIKRRDAAPDFAALPVPAMPD